jgi:predicted membrane-bound spermidine synthase
MMPSSGRVRWRPKFSVVGIAGSVLGAIGVLVFLQQQGKVFPTTIVNIVTILIGIAVGIAVPSLTRLIAIRRINRALARRTRTGAPPAAGPQPGAIT